MAIDQQQLFETRLDHELLSLPKAGHTYRATCRCGVDFEAESTDGLADQYRGHMVGR